MRLKDFADFMRGRATEEGGFASVDALVALTIIAMVMALALQCAASAKRAAAAAADLRQADALLRYIVAVRGDEAAGQTESFSWRVAVTPALEIHSDGEIRLCRRTAEAKSQRSGRRYRLTTLAFCPASST